MKTLTIELPDDVAAALDARRTHLGADSLEEAAVAAVRRDVQRPDAVALETEFARAWNGPYRELTDELVEDWVADIERHIDETQRRG